jgi:hypothetical protein
MVSGTETTQRIQNEGDTFNLPGTSSPVVKKGVSRIPYQYVQVRASLERESSSHLLPLGMQEGKTLSQWRY